MIETRDGKMKSITGFHNVGSGTAYTKAESASSMNKRYQSMMMMGSAADVLRKKHEGIVLKQPDTSYSFKCEGIWNENRSVQWKAKYSKSLEHILYPSLSFPTTKDSDSPSKDTATSASTAPSYTSHSYGSSSASSAPQIAVTDKYNLESTNGLSVDQAIDWEVRISAHQPKEAKKESLWHEIEEAGEKILRENLVKSFLDREQALRAEQASAEDDILGIKKKSGKMKLHDTLMTSLKLSAREAEQRTARERVAMAQSAEDLYAKLVTSSRVASKSHVARAAKKVDRDALSDASYFNHSQALKRVMGDDHAHLMDGVLFYRMRNELTIVDRQEKNMEIKSTPIHVSRSVGKRRQSQLMNQVSARQAHILQTPSIASHLQAVAAKGRKEESKGDKEDDEAEEDPNVKINPFDVSRIRQAVSSRLYGYTHELRPLSPLSRGHPKEHHAATDRKHKAHGHSRNPNLEKMKREAQDELLLVQLENGIIPEDYIQRCNHDSAMFQIDIGGFRIGDQRGLCLGQCLQKLVNLSTLGLSHNRLTCKSIPFILEQVSFSYLIALDLSHNALKGCADALGDYLLREPALQILMLDECGISDDDLIAILKPLFIVNSNLQDLYLNNNRIEAKGANSLANLLLKPHCTLQTVGMAWNNIAEAGATALAASLCVNSTITSLDLSSNNIGDLGAQRIAASLGSNTSLQSLVLQQNSISDRACFVFSMSIPTHPKLLDLNLCVNPLGEAGGRSLFRTILKGLRPFVRMKECTYRIDDDIFNHSYPAMDSPYTLKLSNPYELAILMELVTMARTDPDNAKIDSFSYSPSEGGGGGGGGGGMETAVNLVFERGETINKATGQKWTPVTQGTAKIHFSRTTAMPSKDKAIDSNALTTLEVIVQHAGSDSDRRRFLECMGMDMYCTTEQAQGLINRFEQNKVICHDGLSRKDVIISVWSNLLDTENKFDFLCYNVEPTKRKDLMYALTLEKFKFNWVNPTCHWRLDLGVRAQRNVMLSIICINNIESEYSKNKSGRCDTSQKANWYNFRNERYAWNGIHEITLTKEFLADLPVHGILEFDFVSTTRPSRYINKSSKPLSTVTGSKVEEELDIDEGVFEEDYGDDDASSVTAAGASHGAPGAFTPGSRSVIRPGGLTPVHMNMPTSASASASASAINLKPAPARSVFDGIALTDEEYDMFMKQLNLDPGSRLTRQESIYKLLELQLASTKFYFPVSKVLTILNTFNDDFRTQAHVVVCLFSRILDLYNFERVLKHIDPNAQTEVIHRIGVLNCFNIMKPGFSYSLPLYQKDSALCAQILMDLSENEISAINDSDKTDVAVIDIYPQRKRLVDDGPPYVMRFSYEDFCECLPSHNGKANISWPHRQSFVKHFLVGTQPLDRNLFRIQHHYKAMEAAGTLTSGPVEIQYAAHLIVLEARKRKENSAATPTPAPTPTLSLNI